MTQAGKAFFGKVTNIVNNERYYYVGVKAPPCLSRCEIFGLTSDEFMMLDGRHSIVCESYDDGVYSSTGYVFSIINSLAELRYKVIACTNVENNVVWTLQREL